jgi:AcrR family transcriptional regulator
MAAAKKVFARNGFDGTTIAGVASEADLPFDVVYKYLDSKDALFQALIAAQEHALRTHVAVALAASGAPFGFAEAPFRATLRATFEFFDADRPATKLLLRDADLQDNGFNKRLADIYERFIDDIETLIVAAQSRSDAVAVPPRLIAFTLTTMIGQIAHRRLTTDDGITGAEAADFVVSFVMKGLRPDDTRRGVTEP